MCRKPYGWEGIKMPLVARGVILQSSYGQACSQALVPRSQKDLLCCSSNPGSESKSTAFRPPLTKHVLSAVKPSSFSLWNYTHKQREAHDITKASPQKLHLSRSPIPMMKQVKDSDGNSSEQSSCMTLQRYKDPIELYDVIRIQLNCFIVVCVNSSRSCAFSKIWNECVL